MENGLTELDIYYCLEHICDFSSCFSKINRARVHEAVREYFAKYYNMSLPLQGIRKMILPVITSRFPVRETISAGYPMYCGCKLKNSV